MRRNKQAVNADKAKKIPCHGMDRIEIVNPEASWEAKIRTDNRQTDKTENLCVNSLFVDKYVYGNKMAKMYNGYTKLFSSIITSTIWQEDKETRLVWITMLAVSDQHGDVSATIPGLAKISGVTIPECEKAIKVLMSPDPYSRSQENEGRRIIEVDGGYNILNRTKYRDKDDKRQEYQRLYQRKYRQDRKQKRKQVNVYNKQNKLFVNTERDIVLQTDGSLSIPADNPEELKTLMDMSIEDLKEHKNNPLVMARLKSKRPDIYKQIQETA